MEVSIFLAKFIGVYFLIFCGLWIWRKHMIDQAIEQMLANRALLAFWGLISLIFGAAILVGHPVYELNWRGVITLVGYVAIFKGITRLGFPDYEQRSATRSLRGPGSWIVIGVIGVIGAFLAYSGFMA